MKAYLMIGVIISITVSPVSAEYVEIGSGSSALLSRPYCGN